MMLRAAVCTVFLLCSSAALACSLTPGDKAANEKLSFDAFDQKGTIRSTFRALMESKCYREAADASDDYLANGPKLTLEQKQDVLFHEGQALAYLGRNEEAARLVAAAVPPDRSDHGELDWTTYLAGTYAFLMHDKPALMAAEARMAAEPGDPNRMDGDVLHGLAKCFDRPYAQASTVCRPLWSVYSRKH